MDQEIVTPANVCLVEELCRRAAEGDFTETPIRCGVCGQLAASEEGSPDLTAAARVVPVKTSRHKSSEVRCPRLYSGTALMKPASVKIESTNILYLTHLK